MFVYTWLYWYFKMIPIVVSFIYKTHILLDTIYNDIWSVRSQMIRVLGITGSRNAIA